MNDNKETFHYIYSATQQEEVEAIRKKYMLESISVEVDKMEQLRRLDASVTNKAMVPALISGVVGALIMGFGMSLIMTDLGSKLGGLEILIGILVGIIGMIGVISAYPLYHYIFEKERKKTAPQILQLAEEITKN